MVTKRYKIAILTFFLLLAFASFGKRTQAATQELFMSATSTASAANIASGECDKVENVVSNSLNEGVYQATSTSMLGVTTNPTINLNVAANGGTYRDLCKTMFTHAPIDFNAVYSGAPNGTYYILFLHRYDSSYYSHFDDESDYYLKVVVNSGSVTLDKSVTETRFIEVEPADESTTTNPVTVSARWFISDKDLDKLSTVFSGSANKVRVLAQVCELNGQLSMDNCKKAVEWTLPYGTETSTSTVLSYNLPLNRDYKLIWQLTGSNYYNIFGSAFNVESDTYFTVGSTTHAGHIRVDIASSTVQYKDIGDVYDNINGNCNPFNGGFSALKCVSALVWPPDDLLHEQVASTTDIALHITPIGYLTRFVDLVNATSTATSSLPVIAYTMGTTSFMGATTFSFDPFNSLTTAGSLSKAKSDQTEQKDVWQIFQPVTELIVYIMLFWLMIRKITGIEFHDAYAPVDLSDDMKADDQFHQQRIARRINHNRYTRGKGGKPRYQSRLKKY